jgi:transposase InsO family protein
MREHALLSPHRRRCRREDGTRQALGIALRQQFGHLCAAAARDLALRHDHASTFMSEHFQKQIRFRGIAPSDAFVGEPESNGVIERLFRTLKEQIVHGRIVQTIAEVRDAVRAFAARYNAAWLIGKNRHRSPLDAHAAWLGPKATPEGRYTSLRRAA